MFSFTSFSQTVTLTGQSSGEVEVGIASDFTASVNFPNNTYTYSVNEYVWGAERIGDGSINGITNAGNEITISSNSTSSTVPIIWDGFYDPEDVNVYCHISGIYIDDDNESHDWYKEKSITVHKNGIKSSLYISGDNTI